MKWQKQAIMLIFSFSFFVLQTKSLHLTYPNDQSLGKNQELGQEQQWNTS